MSTIGETREFFLRSEPKSSGVYKDVEADYPVLVLSKQLKSNNLGQVTLVEVDAPNRFVATGIPTVDVIQKLLNSITFKLNVEDTATTSKQGLSKIATVEQALAGLTHDEFGYTLLYTGDVLVTLITKYARESIAPDLAALTIRVELLEDYAEIFNTFIENYTQYELPKARSHTQGGITGGLLGGVIPDGITLGITEDGTLSVIGGMNFVVPPNFTEITNPIGGVNNTRYSTLHNLDGKSVVTVLQEMLFPPKAAPSFIVPITTLSLNPNPGLVEKGTTTNMTLSGGFVSPSSMALEVVGTRSYLSQNVAFTNGSPVTFNANVTFKTQCEYVYNPAYSFNAGDGTSLKANQLSGYPASASSRIINTTQTIYVNDPIWIGCIDAGANIATMTVAQIIALLPSNKILKSSYNSESLTVVSYSGSFNSNKKIVCVSLNTLRSINYVQASNSDVLAAGSFTVKTGQSYTRPDGSITSMVVSYANNPYNANELVTYVFNL